MRDRRHSIRWQINIEAKARLEGAFADISCIVHDLNFYGARISLAQKLPQDIPLKISISLSEEFVLEIEIWVVWHKRLMDKNVYGVYFSKIKDSDKLTIYKFMRDNFPKILNKGEQRIPGETRDLERGEEKMQDRRVFERISVNLPVKLIDLDNNKELEASACDVSAKGLGILTNEYLHIADRLELWLNMPDEREPFYTRGWVVWSKLQDTGQYRQGISLEKADFMGVSRVFRV